MGVPLKKESLSQTSGARDVGALRAAATSAEAARLRAGLRDRLCAGKPGTPHEYRVSVSTTCVARSGVAKSAAEKAARERKATRAAEAGATPSAAATRAEIRILEREMAVAYPNEKTRYDVMLSNGDMIYLSHEVLEKMMNPRVRLLTPDPLVRYNEQAERLRKMANEQAKRLRSRNKMANEQAERLRSRNKIADKPGFDVGKLQRHNILRATLAHLRALHLSAPPQELFKKAPAKQPTAASSGRL
jgi:hypothetical protein